MDGYKLFRRGRQGRRSGGVALCVKEGWDCRVLAVGGDMVESLWVRMRGKANKAGGVVGFYYRSPSLDDDTDVLVYKALTPVLEPVALVLMGDFTFPDVNWDCHTADRQKSRKFVLKHIEYYCLIEVLRELSKKGALLDLLFVNRDGCMGEVMVGGCLVHSDHETVEFKIFGNTRKTVSRDATVDFGRAGFRLLKELVSKVPWKSAFKGIWSPLGGVQEVWTFFKKEIFKCAGAGNPRVPRTSWWGRPPAWLNRELWLELRKKR
ncbi:hypothetical protein FQV18_0002667, partial [Eudyptula minor novaehollandiae]